MSVTQSSSNIALSEPALPKGGGGMRGLGEALGQVGPTGVATMTLPLPVSAGRGYAPQLALSYASGSGNGPFGVGWNIGLPSIGRRTGRGTPQYGDDDEFIGPGGDVLEPERDADGVVVPPSEVSTYNGLALDDTYRVARYFPRIEHGFARIEYWIGKANGGDFWLVHDAGGDLHCFGKTPAACIADPAQPSHIAVWLLQESVSPNGQHIWYRYKPEDEAGVDRQGNEAQRDHTANRYLAEVKYGNALAADALYLLTASKPDDQTWLFSLVLDYGERGTDPQVPPPWLAVGDWPVRCDAFSRYDYGFEVRCHRLCRQVLMFHHFPDELGEPATLVSRLLFEYDENPVLTRLVSVRRLAYEPDDTPQSLPPLELDYTPFDASVSSGQWQPFDLFPGLNNGYPYQLVDLHGEGIAGVLYRVGPLWYYRAPMRSSDGGDAVTYDTWRPLPEIPSLQPQAMALTDINGDGRLDWLVTQPGLAGYFSLAPDGTWSSFTPFSALPIEFFSSKATMADFIGAGLSDLALIGPKSVRLYANERHGFAPGIEVDQVSALPLAGRDARELVAFGDLLGSGQQHLIRIRSDEVRIWPNLGRGRFGQPFVFAPLPFDAQRFDPACVYLADLDGSGAADLLYAESDRIRIFFNQSGNGFAPPVDLALPPGVRFDRLCALSAADVQGQGTTSLVLSIPYPSLKHWRYDFANAKPYLMNIVNNNMGMENRLVYRSSAQEWLDEKQQEKNTASSLPFPVHVVSRQIQIDEISGNRLVQQYQYRKGVYDGQEREFRGFGFMQTWDTGEDARIAGQNISEAPPRLARNWYHTGREEDEAALYGEPWTDLDAFTSHPARLTRFDTKTSQDELLDNPAAKRRWWLYRALNGSLLRSEIYGLDEAPNQQVPYRVTVARYQVREVQTGGNDGVPVAMPSQLEQLDYAYERIDCDPQVSQAVTLRIDAYGIPLHSVAIRYPRRPQPSTSPYPDTLPDTTWHSSYDPQQQCLRFTEQRASVWHRTNPQQWRLGLPWQQRSNVLTYDAARVPPGGLNFENLSTPEGLLGDDQVRIFGTQGVVVYRDTDADGVPDFIALVDHQEVAELDSSSLAAYDGLLDEPALRAKLEEAGYQISPTVLAVPNAVEEPVWVIASGYRTYRGPESFYVPSEIRKTQLTSAAQLSYDSYYCAVTQVRDALGNTTSAQYDYRFLQPWRMIDVNDNHQEVQFDAMGRVVASTFYGTEEAREVGFDPIAVSPVPAGLTVEQAINQAGVSAQRVAAIYATDFFAWMGQIDRSDLSPDEADACWQRLIAARFITPEGHVRVRAHRELRSGVLARCGALERFSTPVREALASVARNPINEVALSADRYPNDAEQQVRINVAYKDGFGRALQGCAKMPGGLAWQRTADGEIVADADGKPKEVDTGSAPRWAVSGRIEYDNKGQPVRSYQPYFLNDWAYVVDNAMRTYGYADTTSYDPIGRAVRVVTTKGYERRQSVYPWFVVSEDENDTA
ncbi:MULTISPECIES: SpvB/TcaC N-terminal domain-containing protein [Burkholderiaceae]|uniref:SpvB/TcaC N-terminal domain-containing protein n=1 Tax=Burkholderiaceae TaxID=119060 RepID=UPI0009603F20|nr:MULTISPECIES: SpvB/TcaC N-terminal domain-containing protein [Burkholderiaceae]MCG1018547.1 toxin [Mycetohabitans sp. B4]SIT79604.1 Insecticide toxin TcdB middle/C-terminal region [Burkholderia sp. b13]